MFGLPILDVGLGLILMYLVLALACTSLNEVLAALLNLRGKKLFLGIENLLLVGSAEPPSTGHTRELAPAEIYAHPLIKSLYRRRWPSYIPSSRFAQAVLDTLLPADSPGPRGVAQLKAAALDLQNPDLRRVLLLVIDGAGDDLAQVQARLEEWFDQSMDRVSGWYKRQTQWLTLLFASALTFAANADTISVANRLSSDAALRDALVAQAKVYAEAAPPQAALAGAPTTTGPAEPDSVVNAKARQVGARIGELQALGLPLGWGTAGFAQLTWPKVLGLVVTALAVSLGAPFWFDMLQRVMAVRASGKPPDEAKPAAKDGRAK